jgi:hypothetical protein
MKRDFDCIRTILIALEALGDDRAYLRSAAMDGFDEETVTYNMHLLIQADLVEGQCSNPLSGPRSCVVQRLTWNGHEFLDNIRPQPIWNRIKAVAREKGLSLTFDAVKAIASSVIAATLK